MKRGLLLSAILALALPLPVAVAQPVPAPSVTQPGPTPRETSPTTQEAQGESFEKDRLEWVKLLADDTKGLPELPATRPSDLFSFRVIGGEAVILTRHPTTNGPAKVTLLGTSAAGATIEIEQEAKETTDANAATHAEGEVPRHFKLKAYYISPTSYGAIEVVNLAAGGMFQIVQDHVTAETTLNVQLIQRMRDPNDASDDALRLLVVRSSTAEGNVLERFNVIAANFEQLRRKHPAETSRFLRPILRELGSESPLFAPDLKAAWQVLSTGLENDPAITGRLRELLPRLDADGFAEREAAQRELRLIGQPAAVALRAMDRAKLTAQQITEIDTFLSSFSPVTDTDVDRLRHSPDFLVDCLELEDRTLRTLAWKHLQGLLKTDQKFDPDAHAETRSPVIAALRTQLAAIPTTQPTPPTAP